MSIRSPFLHVGFTLIVVLALLHFSASFFYLYWVYWWFDALMHFLAGLAGGLVTYWVLAESSWRHWIGERKPSFYIWTVFGCVIVVGVAWEIFEYGNGILDSHEAYPFDVMNDLILDGVGAVLAAFIGTRSFLRRHSSTGSL